LRPDGHHLRPALERRRGVPRGRPPGRRARRRSPDGGCPMSKPARRLRRGQGALIPSEPDQPTSSIGRPRGVFFGADPATGTVPVADAAAADAHSARASGSRASAGKRASEPVELVAVPGATFAYLKVADIVPN